MPWRFLESQGLFSGNCLGNGFLVHGINQSIDMEAEQSTNQSVDQHCMNAPSPRTLILDNYQIATSTLGHVYFVKFPKIFFNKLSWTIIGITLCPTSNWNRKVSTRCLKSINQSTITLFKAIKWSTDQSNVSFHRAMFTTQLCMFGIFFIISALFS